MTQRCIFTKDGKDLLEGIELRNGKANPFGWSTYEVWYVENVGAFVPLETHIADLYCGGVINLVEGYGSRIEDVVENV